MPEYLSPGVYIEEIPSGLQAIQGVSTSTAAFVGPADRGPVPGYVWPGSGTPNLPFTPVGGFLLTPDPSPVLVTSFAQFQRAFGPPLPIATPGDLNDYGFLGWAVKGFFDNGGVRAFIARVVGPAATPSTITMQQGVAYGLARSASKTDPTVYLTSSRGLNVGDAVTFKTHTKDGTGSNVFGQAALPATAVGGNAPFALNPGDKLSVSVDGAPAVAGTWNATAASMSTSATFTGLPGTTLLLTVDSGPVQTIQFVGDAITPLSTVPTIAEVAAFLARFATGVNVTVPVTTTLQVTTRTRGTSAKLQVSGNAAPILAFAITASTGDVANISQVTIAEIATQLPGITVAASSPLQIASGIVGGATHQVVLTEGNAGVLFRLGYGPVSSVTVFGSDLVPATLTIASYNVQQNSITFAAPLGTALDATKVYLLGPTSPNNYQPGAGGIAGPVFIARSPGSWSADVSVSIVNADRQPVAVTAPVATPLSVVPVQNVASFYIGGTVEIDHNGVSRTVHQVTAINQGLRQLTIDPPLAAALLLPASVRTLEITITVTDLTGASPTETYKGMAWAQGGSADVRRHYAWTINANSALVWVEPPVAANEDYELFHQPMTADGFPVQPAGGNVGVDGLPTNDGDWIGQDNGPGQRSGIQALLDVSQASIIAAPGKASAAIQLALIDQCELMRYRFAVLDGDRDPAGGSITSILAHRNLYDTSFAAYYQPWITISAHGQNWQLPPSCFLPGIYARVDIARGIWKAPANESVLDALALKTNFGKGEQDLLNPRGVNLIRQFDQGGIRVWGARTVSSDTDLMYINVRRTLIFLEQSIDQGTQWVVFESNTPETWGAVTASVSAFLLTQWRNGALFGRSPSQAFFVTCDETTMTSDDILNGRLICKVGVAIVRPAEFVIFRIQQITNFIGGGA